MLLKIPRLQQIVSHAKPIKNRVYKMTHMREKKLAHDVKAKKLCNTSCCCKYAQQGKINDQYIICPKGGEVMSFNLRVALWPTMNNVQQMINTQDVIHKSEK